MLVTTGRSLVKYGYLDELLNILKELLDEKVFVFEKISANPQLEEVKHAIKFGKEKSIQCVIGFGGGSSIDAAKAIAVGIAASDDIENYLLNGKEPDEKTLPIIAIPTTAGTGSELSKGAIISSKIHQIKAGIRGKNILPKVAIVDDVFTWTVPLRITMETGFDVLAHAIESFVAVKANCFSEMLSEKAIRIVGENLPLLYNNINNHDARKQMCFASMIMGMNLANVGTCLPHRMQYAIGAYTDTSHGAGLLAIYPKWIRYEYQVNSEKINKVLYWLGGIQADTSEQAEELMVSFFKKMDISYSLSDLNIHGDMIERLMEKVTGNLANDKLASKHNIVKSIFTDTL